VDDVTFASASGSGVVLGGRKLDRPYRGIRVQDVAAIWKSENEQSARQTGSGFSLDPQVDLARLTEFHRANLESSAGRAYFGEQAIAAASEALQASDDRKYFDALQEGCEAQHHQGCDEMVRDRLLWPNLLQAARYDGRLQGTEVGMVLFYTDLLMKMWSLDYAGCSPRAVEGFPVKTEILIPALFRAETEKLTETRLWLGPLDRGYQVAHKGDAILFARNATRVFAVPHDFRENKDKEHEVEPNYYNRIFITWWNDHFEEVARYEPEYERLNEIMKWSELIGWLNAHSKGDRLGFLETVPDEPARWFPEWVKQHHELTFQAWDSVPFHEKGYGSLKTESLPILRSALNKPIPLRGGVSLATRDALEARTVLAEDLASSVRRAGIDSSELTATGGKLRMLDKSEFAFQTEGNVAKITAHTTTETRFRGEFSELKNMEFEHVLERTPGSFELRTQAGGKDVGDLAISRTNKGFRVGWKSRDVDLGQSLGRRISSSGDPVQVLRADPDVETVVALGNGRGLLAKTRGTGRWIHFAAGGPEDTTVSVGFQARVSGPEGRPVNVGWLNNGEVAGEMKSQGYVYIADEGGTGGAPVLRVSTRGPPEGLNAETIDAGGTKLKGYHDAATGSRIFRFEDLPAEFQQEPLRLASLSGDTVPKLGQASAKFAGQMRDRQYQAAAKQMIADQAEFRNASSGYLKHQLLLYDDLMQQKQFALAMQSMNDAIDVFGRSPDLVLRKALAEIGQGRNERAIASLREAAPQRMRNPDDFFNEINHRLEQAGAGSREQGDLSEFARLAEWRQRSLATPQYDAQMLLAVDRDSLRLRYETGKLPSAQRGELSAVLRGDAPVYVQDAPGLNNLDWNASMHTTLQELISGNRVAIQELDLIDIADFRPSVVYEAQSRTSYRLAGVGQSQITRWSPRYYNANTQDDDEKKKRRHKVYMIVPTSSAAAR
jgi:hypothetical protein